MIPDINETLDMIERDLPGYNWLLRTIDPHSERDHMRGQGKFFAHVFKLEGAFHVATHKVCEESAGAALYRAYNEAMHDLSKH